MTNKFEMKDKSEPRRLAVPLREIDPFPNSVMPSLTSALKSYSKAVEGDVLAFSFEGMLDDGMIYPCGEIMSIVAYPRKQERMQSRRLHRDFDNLDRCAAAALGSYGAVEENRDIRKELNSARFSLGLPQEATVNYKIVVTASGLIAAAYPGNLEEDGYHDINAEELIRLFVFRGQSAHQKLAFLSDIKEISMRAVPFLHGVMLVPE